MTETGSSRTDTALLIPGDGEEATTALARVSTDRVLAPRAEGRLDLPRVCRRCARLAAEVRALDGPGAAAVRTAAERLVAALELYVQQRRRLGAEALRDERTR